MLLLSILASSYLTSSLFLMFDYCIYQFAIPLPSFTSSKSFLKTSESLISTI